MAEQKKNARALNGVNEDITELKHDDRETRVIYHEPGRIRANKRIDYGQTNQSDN